jgi:multiple sugar transport system substrate-binding protein
VSGRYGTDAYYGSSGCPLNASSSPTEVKINVTDPACARVNAVIGPLMANGTLSTLDPFDANYVKTVSGGKLLAAIMPSWFGAYGIKPNYKKNGDYAVAAMPTWAGASDTTSGAVGGGLWLVSATSGNVKAATDFVKALTTDEKILVAGATYPAHAPAPPRGSRPPAPTRGTPGPRPGVRRPGRQDQPDARGTCATRPSCSTRTTPP